MAEVSVLRVRGVSKYFPGVRALYEVGMDVHRGEVHALVGENGAGKSTLMHVLGGIYRPEGGEIFLEGKPAHFASPRAAAEAGIAVVYQELSLVPNLSVAENIFANRQPVRAMGWINREGLNRESARLLAEFEASIDPWTPVKFLSVAQQQVVEILKAISWQPKVLILDEPTSSLTQVESDQLFASIRRLKARGMSFIFISHHLEEVFKIADRVTVLRDGRYIGTRDVNAVSEHDLIGMMVGRELTDMYGTREDHGRRGEEYFRVQGLARDDAFWNVEFSVRRGEIVALSGLVGAGRTELARAIFGAEPAQTGTISLEGRPLRITCPGDAIKAGIGYLTEDRKGQGLFTGMPIAANCVAPSIERFMTKLSMMRDRAIRNFAEENRNRFGIVCRGIMQRVFNLSGGNQQKVLFAMWAGMQPKLLIADEPTRGVDVGAKSDIYHHLRTLAAQGTGILMISSDLPEVLGVSDRILVMRRGRIVAEYSRAEATEERIVAAAVGVG